MPAPGALHQLPRRSRTARITAEQLHALLQAAGQLSHGRGPLAELYTHRATAVTALLSPSGLRVSEVVGLDRSDLHRSGGEEVLRVRGKGDVTRSTALTGVPAPRPFIGSR